MQATRIVGGMFLTAGLAALGLWLSGSGARALAYVQPALDGIGEVKALSGSGIGDAQRIQLNGRQMRVLECTSSKAPSQILEHYCEVADGQTTPEVPFLLSRAPGGGGVVMWVSPQGEARAVCVETDPLSGGSRYRIIIDPSGKALGDPSPDAALVGGLRGDELGEFSVQSSVADEDGSGLLILSGRGSVPGAANRILGALEARGFDSDRRALEAYDAASALLVVPLTHPSGLRGTLSVKADSSRVPQLSLTLYPTP